MELVELGRLVTSVKKADRNEVKVIIGIQDKNFVILQTPTSMKRERLSTAQIKLLEFVIPVTEEMSPSEVQDVIDSTGAVKEYKKSDDYLQWEKEVAYIEANDFEKFKMDLKERIQNDLIKEKLQHNLN